MVTLFAALASVIVPVPLVEARRPEAEISWLCVRLPLVPAVRLVTPDVVRPAVTTVPTANPSTSTYATLAALPAIVAIALAALVSV